MAGSHTGPCSCEHTCGCMGSESRSALGPRWAPEPRSRDVALSGTCWGWHGMGWDCSWRAAVDVAAVPGHLLPAHACCAEDDEEGGRKAAHPCHWCLACSGCVRAGRGLPGSVRGCSWLLRPPRRSPGQGAGCGVLRTGSVWQSVDAGG